ncbi:MAG: GAF domain-containing sensor histidine kinase [Lachnospiraceae bacterium]|nr:GAF domain-containing sensor histidine kinase [Lachnospiraceae bacterium]
MRRSNESIISEISLKLVKEAECSGIQKCVELVGRELGLDGGLVLRTNEIPFLLEMRCCWDPREVIVDRNLLLDYSESPEYELFNPWGAAGRLNIIEDTTDGSVDAISKDFFEKIGAGSFVGCPMLHDGEYLGGMCFYGERPRLWADDELELIKEVAKLASYVVARIKLDESTKYLLEEINRRIIDADGAKNRFMNNITNEMRTPLNSAMGMVSIMRHNIDNANVMEDCIGRMEVLVKQLIGLVGECADTSLISGNDHLVNRTWIQLDPLVSGVRKFIDPLVAGKKQNLEFDYDPQESVLADEVKLARILINVLTCSSRFAKENTDILVSFRIEKVGNRQPMLIISVKDEYGEYGPDNAVNVFDPFADSKGSSRGQLSSLGLTMAITRHMTEVMNGSCFRDGCCDAHYNRPFHRKGR